MPVAVVVPFVALRRMLCLFVNVLEFTMAVISTITTAKIDDTV